MEDEVSDDGGSRHGRDPTDGKKVGKYLGQHMIFTIQSKVHPSTASKMCVSRVQRHYGNLLVFFSLVNG